MGVLFLEDRIGNAGSFEASPEPIAGALGQEGGAYAAAGAVAVVQPQSVEQQQHIIHHPQAQLGAAGFSGRFLIKRFYTRETIRGRYKDFTIG